MTAVIPPALLAIKNRARQLGLKMDSLSRRREIKLDEQKTDRTLLKVSVYKPREIRRHCYFKMQSSVHKAAFIEEIVGRSEAEATHPHFTLNRGLFQNR